MMHNDDGLYLSNFLFVFQLKEQFCPMTIEYQGLENNIHMIVTL